MSAIRTAWARLVALFTGDRADAQLRDELESHLEIATDEWLRRGMSPTEARRRALLETGGITGGVEAVREQRGIAWLESLGADVRYALRALRLRPGFTMIVLITLALGIGANAAMFTIVNAVVIRPLPFPDPDRIVSVSVSDQGTDRQVLPDDVLSAWGEIGQTAHAVGATGGTSAVLRSPGGAETVRGQLATPGVFDVFAVRPLLGRTFRTGEELPGAAPVVVLSEQLWRRLGADSSVIGRSMVFDQTPRTIIGVMPASFTTTRRAQFWTPLNAAPRPNVGEMRLTRFYAVVARLKPDADIQMARVELDGILKRRDPSRIADRTERSVVMTLHERRHGDSRKPALLLLAAVGVLLLIACANLASLALARAAKRQREFAMRMALGASRWRLARFVLAENMLVAMGGGLLGILLAAASVGSFVRVSPGSVASVEGIRVNGMVVAFTFGVALLTGVLFGLVPALTAGGRGLNEALSNGSQRSSSGRRQQLLQRILVVAELATAIVFLTGAGLVGKTLYHVTRLDAGFDSSQLLSANVNLPDARYTAGPAANAVFTTLLDNVQRLPSVRSAAWTVVPPFGGVAMSVQQVDSLGASRRFDVVGIGPRYLETIGARLLSGRTLTDDDQGGAPNAAVVSQTYARTMHPVGEAIGATVNIGGKPHTIVGIVSDVQQRDLEDQPTALVFMPLAQGDGQTQLTLMARTTGDPELLRPVIVDALRAIDATIPAPTFTTMARVLATETAPRRFTFALIGVFALLAALIAILGLYGLLSYLVSEQTREIGIRVALGATGGDVTRRIVGHGMLLVVGGSVIGVAAAIAAVRVLKTMVFGMSVYDVQTFAAMTAALVVTGLAAAYIPARRASRVDPVIALRAD